MFLAADFARRLFNSSVLIILDLYKLKIAEPYFYTQFYLRANSTAHPQSYWNAAELRFLWWFDDVSSFNLNFLKLFFLI